jgi:hypothetical protein
VTFGWMERSIFLLRSFSLAFSDCSHATFAKKYLRRDLLLVHIYVHWIVPMIETKCFIEARLETV